MRPQALNAIRKGQDVPEFATAYGVNARSLFRFAHGEPISLLSKPIPERPPKVSEKEMGRLAKEQKDYAPLQF